MGIRQKITTTIDSELKELCDERGIVISDILDDAVKEVLERISAASFREMQQRLQANVALRDKLMAFVEKNGLQERWLKENVGI